MDSRKMNSNSSNVPVDLSKLLDMGAASKKGPDFLVDTTAIQKRVDLRMQNPFRRLHGLFRLPREASQRVKEEMTRVAIGNWLRMNPEWALLSDIPISGPFQAHDAEGNVSLFGVDEYRMEATFRYVGPTPKPVRIEFPRDGIKQDPEHRLDLRTAMKVWGVAPLPGRRRVGVS